MLDLKQEPNGYYDILHIVEHPQFIQFYEDLKKDMIFEEKEEVKRKDILGDIITVGLKENYKDYDFYIPYIVKDREEMLSPKKLSADNFKALPWTLKQLKSITDHSNEIFEAQEMTVKTLFGEYKVHSGIFDAKSYNDFLAKIVEAITTNISKYHEEFPILQINQTSLAAVIDEYIRSKLFEESFDPMERNNWRILMLLKGEVIKHIMKEVSQSIYELLNNVKVEGAIVKKRYFSEVQTLKIRKNFSLNIQKSIYERTGYPSNKGEFEKSFLEFVDADSEVERLLKINENYHKARMKYIRIDGMLSSYSPDFMVKIGSDIYIVETKAQKDVSQENVVQKQTSALDWIKKVNELHSEDRMNSIWHYVILDDKTFENMKRKGASAKYMLDYCELIYAKVNGNLF